MLGWVSCEITRASRSKRAATSSSASAGSSTFSATRRPSGRRAPCRPRRTRPAPRTHSISCGPSACRPSIIGSLRRWRIPSAAPAPISQRTKIVPAPPHHVVRCRAVAVVRVRDHQQIEILVRLDQRVGDEHRLIRRHVGVHRAVGEQQVALQVLREVLIRFGVVAVGAVGVLDDESLIALAPVVLVLALIVVARLRRCPTLKKSGKRNIAVVVANPPPEWPQMPARRCRSTDNAAPAPSCRRSDRESCCRGPSRRSTRPGTPSIGLACPCRRS